MGPAYGRRAAATNDFSSTGVACSATRPAGEGRGEGSNLNLPLPAGSSAAEWFSALEVACARVARHRAEALVVSLGLDTWAGDPISKFALTGEDFVRLGARFAKLGLPAVLVLEGGYATRELGENAANVLDGIEEA